MKRFPPPPAFCHLLAAALVLSAAIGRLEAHPTPDIPVRTYFGADGSIEIRVELDTRCFVEDPDATPYLLQEELEGMDAEEKAALLAGAARFLASTIDFYLDSPAPLQPRFEWAFTTFVHRPLAAPGDPVVITGTWRTAWNGASSYRIRSRPGHRIAVMFYNHYEGRRLQRFNALFPDEFSYALEREALPGMALADDSAPGLTGPEE